MAGAMHGSDSAATSPSGDDADPDPSDCSACVTIAAMGAFTLPAAVTLAIPLLTITDVGPNATELTIHRFAHSAYASRAPPNQQA